MKWRGGLDGVWERTEKATTRYLLPALVLGFRIKWAFEAEEICKFPARHEYNTWISPLINQLQTRGHDHDSTRKISFPHRVLLVFHVIAVGSPAAGKNSIRLFMDFSFDLSCCRGIGRIWAGICCDRFYRVRFRCAIWRLFDNPLV